MASLFATIEPPTMVVVPASPSGSSIASPGTRRTSFTSTAWSGNGSVPPPRSSASGSPPSAALLKKSGTGDTAAVKHSYLTRIRQRLINTVWYKSAAANRLRTFLAGKAFALIMVLCLLLALFMPDTWVLAGVNSNLAIDIVLSVVMVLFIVELVLLSLVDASYVLSFFQIMDIVGTISMIFDISYMLGSDATFSPLATNSGEASKNLMLLRASRAAKIGARAGRLSRVLRILRFLPFLAGGAYEKQRTGIASMISGRLANLLATRVACLTIILVMITPLFDIMSFPQSDFSLQAWVDRIAQNLLDGRANDAVAEMRFMEEFFNRHGYWPFGVCVGAPVVRNGMDDFACNDSVTDMTGWLPARPAPPRGASSLRVQSGTVMVAFNMHSTLQLKSGLAIATILFIIVIMIFSSLALSSVVTELAVRPLERMLGTVRQIAQTVFKFSAEVADTEDEQATIDSSNEMKLLEKVVQKLAIVADLQTSRIVQATEDMRDEDLGILSMMQGKNVKDEMRGNLQARKSCAAAVVRKKALAPTVRLEDFGVPQETYNSWSFNTLPLTKTQRISLAVFTMTRHHDAETFLSSQADLQTLQRFMQAVEKEYLPVPFHNFAHAVDVLHGASRLMHRMGADAFLTELDSFVLLVAGTAHDLGHPGVNNGFLSEVGHELALQYNDRSPLENMHCAKLYTLVANPLMNVFSKLTKEQYREARKNCIEVILHTDMMMHGSIVKDLQMTYQMDQEVFNSMADGPLSDGSHAAVVEVLTQPATKMLVMETILHSADVSNPCRAWETTHAWALVCLEEFFAQGDQEKMLGIPVQFLNDRDKLNKPNSQVGFIEFMIAPLFVAAIRLWPTLHELGGNLASNLAIWADLWEKEVNPNDDERKKVHDRVAKVAVALKEAAVTRRRAGADGG